MIPKCYSPISLLCNTYNLYERIILNRVTPLLEQHLIKEQAGFGMWTSCTSELLNLTQHIEDGYQRGMITGAAFVNLSAAYDTVDHRILIQKLYNITQDSQLCRVLQNMLSNRRLYVELNNECSRWIIQKNGLPQGSVLSPILFNMYTNDQPLHDGTRSFIYADDLRVTDQYSSFTAVERTIGDVLDKLTRINTSHYFSLKEQRGKSISKSGMEQDRSGEYSTIEVYVTLDRTLGYKPHIYNTKMKVETRNNILRQLSNSKWAANASTIRTTALTQKLNPKLNQSM